jgi:predicted lipid-binding transport protein (Tim44 family)
MSIAIAREPLPPTLTMPAPAPEAPAASPTGEPSAFSGLLQSLAGEMNRGESLTRSALGAARGGQAIGPAELIALQAGIYRYGEAVDLASRLIDRATSAVKTVVQGT